MDKVILHCNSCGSDYYDWACDYCYTQSVITKIER